MKKSTIWLFLSFITVVICFILSSYNYEKEQEKIIQKYMSLLQETDFYISYILHKWEIKEYDYYIWAFPNRSICIDEWTDYLFCNSVVRYIEKIDLINNK
jgi:hypothetical protein